MFKSKRLRLTFMVIAHFTMSSFMLVFMLVYNEEVLVIIYSLLQIIVHFSVSEFPKIIVHFSFNIVKMNKLPFLTFIITTDT